RAAYNRSDQRRVQPVAPPHGADAFRSDPAEFPQLPRTLGIRRGELGPQPSFGGLRHARNQNSELPLSPLRHPAASWEGIMAASPASEEAESRRRPARASDKDVVDLAGDALKEIATLLRTELQLLRAEISEKFTFTALSAALIGAGALLLM